MAWSAAAVIFALLSIWIAAANLAVLLGVFRKWLQGSKDFSMTDVTDSIIVQIAVADFVYGVLTFAVLALAGGDTTSSSAACALSAANITFTPVFSIFGLVLLAYCRYSIVRHELSSQGISFKNASIIAGVIWVLCLALAIYSSSTGVPATSSLYCRRESTVAGGLVVLIAVFAPSVAIFWLYFKIMQAVRRSTLDQQVPRRVAKMIFAINLVYIVTLFPYGGTGLYSVIVGEHAPATWDAVTLIITNLNYASNPILYCVFQRKYRRAVLELTGIKFLLESSSLGATSRKSDTTTNGTGTTSANTASTRLRAESDYIASANIVPTSTRKTKTSEPTEVDVEMSERRQDEEAVPAVKGVGTDDEAGADARV